MRIFLLWILCVFVTVAFCEGVLPQGQGTEEAPFLIETLENLRYISENSDIWENMYYLQTADIDASSTQNWNSGLGFKPLGEVIIEWIPNDMGILSPVNVFYPFNSHYDGGNHTISNLFINREDEMYLGFISNQNSGGIQNLNLVDVDISGDKNIAGLIGYTSSYIDNCSVSGDVSCNDSNVGGIVCFIDNGTISNSSFMGNVEAGSYLASLLVADIISGVITNCDVEGTVTAPTFAAGIYAHYSNDIPMVEDCSVNVDIVCSGEDYGVFSSYVNQYTITGYSNFENIKNTFYSTNSSINNLAFNLFGSLSDFEFLQWINNNKIFDPNEYYSSGNNGYLINNVEDLKNLRFFYNREELTFILNSDISVGTSTTSIIHSFNSTFDGNNHTISNLTIESSTYPTGLFGNLGTNSQISNLTLDNFNINANKYVGCLGGISSAEITNCSVLNSNIDSNLNAGLLLGSHSKGNVNNCSVSGTLSGNSSLGGIFGESLTNYGSFTNCSSNSTITGSSFIGGIGGYSVTTMNNCETQGTITGNTNVGGICGTGNVNSSWSGATITGRINVGGITGNEGLITNSYFVGTITGGTNVGGIAGSLYNNYFCSISNCFSDGIIQGCVNVGGIIGKITSNTSYPSFVGFNQIDNSYSNSTITGEDYNNLTTSNIGGFVGYADAVIFNNCYTTSSVNAISGLSGGFSAVTTDLTSTNNCFWSSELSGQTSSASATNVTATQLQSQAIFTDAGWDFDTIWGLSPDLNNGYPVLRDVFYTDNADDEEIPEVSSVTYMKSAYPNPFNPETTIEFFVENKDIASLTIYNIKGQVVKKYSNFLPGQHKVLWNGLNNNNQHVSSGLYLYQLKGKDTNSVKKMILMK